MSMLDVAEVDDLKDDVVRDRLRELITKLDDLDGDDFFGSKGWRYFLGFGD